MRLIDADLIDRDTFSDCENATECVYAIGNIPTADVQPVVNGEWVETSECLSSSKHYCSKCEKFAKTHLVISFNSTPQFHIEEYLDDYCPNCGARIGGENNDT